MAIPKDTIQRIYETAKIEEVVGDYVTLRRRGANMLGLCPFHNEKTPSFNVSPSRGIYKCFGCGKAGHAVNFVMEIEQCSYVEALRMVAKKYHIEIEEREQTEEEKQAQDDRESMTRVNEFCNDFFQKQLWETEEGRVAGQGYLIQKRRIREDIIRKFQLGYSPEKNCLTDALKKHGFNEKYTVNDAEHEPHIGTGVICRSQDGRLFDRFHGRVMFPFFSTSGKVIGFAGRIIKPNDKVGKYVNSPTSPLFEKHNALYGFYQAKHAIQRQNECILVEGQLDVISMVQSGIENVVSSGGTSLTKPQIRLIHRFTPNMTIIYDGDKAGIKAALRGIDMVLEEGMNVKIVLLPEGQDPDEFAKDKTSEELQAYIEQNKQDFIRFKTKLLTEEADKDPQKMAQLINEVVTSIAVIPDSIMRQQYVKDTAYLLQFKEEQLAKKVAEFKNNPNREHSINIDELSLNDNQEQKNLKNNYKNLLQLIVRYGEQILYTMEDGSVSTVGSYILSELSGIDCTCPDKVYEKIMQEFEAHSKEEGFKAEEFFKFHEDPKVSELATELMIDPYMVQMTIDEKHLPNMVQKMLNELRLTNVGIQLKDVTKQMKMMAKLNDIEGQQQTFKYQVELKNYERQIRALLGR